MNVFIYIVKFLAFVIAISVWCTVGLAVWIALVCRVTAAATLRITATLIASAGHGSIESATKSIEEAAAMWCRGAVAIAHGFFGKDKENVQSAASTNWKRVLQEISFSVLLYGSIVIYYNGLQFLNNLLKFNVIIKNASVEILSSWTFWIVCVIVLIVFMMFVQESRRQQQKIQDRQTLAKVWSPPPGEP
jgi:hypothetical protein